MLVISRCVEMDVCAETAVCIVLFFSTFFVFFLLIKFFFWGGRSALGGLQETRSGRRE